MFDTIKSMFPRKKRSKQDTLASMFDPKQVKEWQEKITAYLDQTLTPGQYIDTLVLIDAMASREKVNDTLLFAYASAKIVGKSDSNYTAWYRVLKEKHSNEILWEGGELGAEVAECVARNANSYLTVGIKRKIGIAK